MVLKEVIITVSTLGGGCGGLERTDCNNFFFGEDVVVSKEVILTVSILGEEVVVLKELILIVSSWERKWCVERIDFNNFYLGRKWWS